MKTARILLCLAPMLAVAAWASGSFSVEQRAAAHGPEVVLRDATANTTATVLPQAGFNCWKFTVGTVEFLAPPVEPAAMAKGGAGFGWPILFPFPNRVAKSEFAFGGKTYRVGPGRGNAIHGFVCAQPWRVTATGTNDGASVTGVTDTASNPLLKEFWPWPCRLTVTYRLAGRALTMTAVAENLGTEPMPFGLGVHPYQPLPLTLAGTRARCWIQVPCRERLELTPDCIPTGRRVPATEWFEGRALGDTKLDDVFTSTRTDANGSACVLRDPDSPWEVTLHADAAFQHWVVYAPQRNVVCFEPYTCVTDAFNLHARGVPDTGFAVLEPGKPWRGTVTLRVRELPDGKETMNLKLTTIILLCATLAAQAAETQNPPRLKRADSFLGMHFDFHAGMDCTNVGAHTTAAMVENIINLVHPDYLQIDCKGHPGISSYPTKVGYPAPGIVGDPLRIWREVTARRGVALYMHYSGVYERQAIRNPGWAALNADGKPNDRATSFFGPYSEKLLIPQLRELAGVYGVDGAWVDGECWASVPDFGAAALKAFRETTGIAEVPRKPGQPHWFEFLQFHREQFRQYLRHYVAEVKKTNPEFQLCSNWAYTDHMPEPVSAPVDFLSGDYSPDNSVNSARLSARYLARQGKPWDLMAWSFAGKNKTGRMQKSAVQLEREAAVVLALGGGFEAYFKQKRDGSIYDEQMPVMAEVAKFCRARQAICHHAQAVPQIALLLSTAGHYRKINGLFNRDFKNVSGALQALLEGQQSVEVVDEHQLAGRLAEYPLIVVPEWDYLEPQFKNDLVAYVKAGGNLLLIGPKTAALFQDELGVKLTGEVKPGAPRSLVHGSTVVTLKTDIQSVQLGAQTRPFGELRVTNVAANVSQPAASIAMLGRGQIAATFFTFGPAYLTEPSVPARNFLNDLVRQLFPTPLVNVAGSSDVDVCVARNHGKLLVNLVNTSGPHRTEPIIESIPPVGPLSVTIQLAKQPAKVTLEPAGQPLAGDYRDGKLHLTIPQVAIHDIIAIAP